MAITLHRIVFATVLALIVSGCATSLKRTNLTASPKYLRGVQVKVFENQGGMPNKEAVLTLMPKRGDSVRVVAMAAGGNAMGTAYDFFYLGYNGTDTLWYDNKDLLELGELECENRGGIVRVSKDKSDEAWSRAVSYVNKYSDMKIQTTSDYIIDTYNPTSATKRGYTITKVHGGDSTTIEIEVKGYPGSKDKCDAYNYIKYGGK